MNILGKTMGNPNWHLVAQIHQIAQVYDLNFRILTLEEFDWQLVHILSDLIPDIKGKISMVGRLNASKKPIPKSEILTPDLREYLKDITLRTFKLFAKCGNFGGR